MFGSGTAALVSPVSQFTYNDNKYDVPYDETKGAGPLTQKMLKMLVEYQTGVVRRPEWQYPV